MTKITIICVGKIKEKFFSDAIDEYRKRLSRYCRLEIIEVIDEKTPDRAPDAICDQIRDKEGERILKVLDDKAFTCTLEIAGKKFTSEGFSDFIKSCEVEGKSHIQFIIGGSLGLGKKVLERSDMAISFSDMTFPHQLMRVILLEQVYRAYRIINNEPYHK